MGKSAEKENALAKEMRERAEEIQSLDTYDNMRLIALSIAMNENAPAESRIEALEFLYPSRQND